MESVEKNNKWKYPRCKSIEMKDKWNEDSWKSIEMEDKWKDHGWKGWKWSVTRLTLHSAAKPELAKVAKVAKVGSSFWQAEF